MGCPLAEAIMIGIESAMRTNQFSARLLAVYLIEGSVHERSKNGVQAVQAPVVALEGKSGNHSAKCSAA